jgi:hypothetical protein
MLAQVEVPMVTLVNPRPRFSPAVPEKVMYALSPEEAIVSVTLEPPAVMLV